MSSLGWLTVAGLLLLVMAVAGTVLRRLPVSTSLVYLACGLAIGPAGLGWLALDLVAHASWFERLSEVAVIVSLFIGGLKLRLPPSDPAWRAAWILAGPVMLVCIAAVAVFACGALDLPWHVALTRDPHPDHGLPGDDPAADHPPAEHLVAAHVESDDMRRPHVAAGVVLHDVITFGDTAERMLEAMLVVLVGAALGSHWDPRAVLVAFVLFAVVRPAASRALLAGTPTSAAQRWLMGWFGIRASAACTTSAMR